MKKAWITNLLLFGLMILASGLAYQGRPTEKIASSSPMNLEASIPQKLNDWEMETTSAYSVVNPQQVELLKKLYSQILSRTYINTKNGQRVMLSVAYGEDQRDGLQLHYPDICYPAQGFQLISNHTGNILTSFGTIPVRRLETALNKTRMEPVTYWTMIGDYVVLGGYHKKIAELQYGLRGKIADGLVFRVSSIDQDTKNAFLTQDIFVRDLVLVLSMTNRKRITGLGNVTETSFSPKLRDDSNEYLKKLKANVPGLKF